MRAKRSCENELILGLVSISDRASRGEYRDEGIPALQAWCEDAITTPVQFHTRLIEDDQYTIEETLRELVDRVGCDLVFTTGGTGPARRDVTPEATLAVGTREMPGFAEQMRRISLNFVPTAILSRQVAVLRETPTHAALIVNLPGRPKSISETLGGFRSSDGEVIDAGIFASIPYCIDLIGGPYIETDPSIIDAFRPKNARRPKAEPVQEQPKPTPMSAEALTPNFPKTTDALNQDEQRERERLVEQAKAQIEAAKQNAPRGVPLYHAEAHDATPSLDVVVKDPINGLDPSCTVIWLHGMGTNADDFAPFPQEHLDFGGPAARFIMPNAPEIALTAHHGWRTSAWYDILSNNFSGPEDQIGINKMHLQISQIINEIISTGVPAERIFLGGFSQGAAMALYSGLRQARTLGGVIALSGYLPLANNLGHDISIAGRSTPVFMAHGAFDSVVSPILAKRSADIVDANVQTLIWREYNMEHELCAEEITHIAQFMNTALQI